MAMVFFHTITGPKITDGTGDEMWLTSDVWCEALDEDGLFPNNAGTTTAQTNYWVKFNHAATDTNNTFVATGNWPVPSGSISIGSPTATTSQNIAVKISNVTPKFGSTLQQSINCQLSGVEKVPGTATISAYVYLPRKRYLAPLAPATVTLSSTTVTCTGNQTNASADRFWTSTDLLLQKNSDAWVEDNGSVGTTTSWPVTLEANARYQAGVRAWNADGGRGPITYSSLLYTTPSTPTAVTAARQATKTPVRVTWTNNAAWAASYVVERSLNGGAWTQVGTPATTTFDDTNVPLSATAIYRVKVLTPTPVVGSAWSASSATVGQGYTLPGAPVVTLTRIDDSSVRVTISGNQSNPALDKYWERIYWSIQTDTAAYVGSDYVSGDTTSFTIPGCSADHRYKVMARVWNSAGYGEFGLSGYVYTTPAAPSAATATRLGASTTVNVVTLARRHSRAAGLWTSGRPSAPRRAIQIGSSWLTSTARPPGPAAAAASVMAASTRAATSR